jgi:hypothetical protein
MHRRIVGEDNAAGKGSNPFLQQSEALLNLDKVAERAI